MISVVIPALNEESWILPSIFSVKGQSASVELIVVDGGSVDRTAELAAEHATVISSARGRGIQMNAGANVASGQALLFLHADSRLHPGSLAGLERALEDPRVVGGTFTLRFDSGRFPLGLYAFATRFRFRHFHYGDQGIFVRRSVFEDLGGFSEITLLEDVDFLRRLRRLGPTALLRLPVTTSARRFVSRGTVRQQLLNLGIVLAYSLGADPDRLARWYEPHRAGLPRPLQTGVGREGRPGRPPFSGTRSRDGTGAPATKGSRAGGRRGWSSATQPRRGEPSRRTA